MSKENLGNTFTYYDNDKMVVSKEVLNGHVKIVLNKNIWNY